MYFNKKFIWGVSTSAYQIEGAAFDDGKGLSVWDDFCKHEGAVWRGQNGNVTCDHYHKYKEDIALLKELGVNAYRLSISWPRVIPGGTGKINKKGIDFYHRLIDELLAKDIQPYVTLFHWDYPLSLFNNGGWLNTDSPDWFAEYAQKMVYLFSDRVKDWFTMNEPQCFISLGHYQGEHAPGMKLSLKEALQAGHHALLAHGKAAQVIRQEAKQPVKIGYSTATQVRIPDTNNKQDIDAARKAMHGMLANDLWNNSWWMDPVHLGKYPEEGLSVYGKDAPHINQGDMKTIAQPLDYCCVNVYTAKRYKADKNGKPEFVPPAPGYNRTAQEDWPVEPDALYWTARFMHERYNLPILVTENGHQNLDHVSLDGNIHDPQRTDYLNRQLMGLEKAIKENIPVTGYFVWTLMDNFEWSFGYKVRVGLVYTDYTTLKRIPKDSFYWYRDFISKY